MSSIEPAPQFGRIAHRRFVFSVWGNTLARTSDRAEAVVGALFLGIWLFMLPVSAVAGATMFAGLSGDANAQQERVSATAVLLAPTAPQQVASDGTPLRGVSSVQARWTDPGGFERTALVPADDGLQTGDQIEIWLDPSGAVTTAPVTTLSALTQAVIVATVGWASCGLMLAAVFLTGRKRLDRRRLSDWTTEWQTVGPNGTMR